LLVLLVAIDIRLQHSDYGTELFELTSLASYLTIASLIRTLILTFSIKS